MTDTPTKCTYNCIYKEFSENYYTHTFPFALPRDEVYTIKIVIYTDIEISIKILFYSS